MRTLEGVHKRGGVQDRNGGGGRGRCRRRVQRVHTEAVVSGELPTAPTAPLQSAPLQSAPLQSAPTAAAPAAARAAVASD
jgi:hypothetical protein